MPCIVAMEIALTHTPEEILTRFYALHTRRDVAELLEVEDRFLRAVLYGVKERTQYRIFEIQKKPKGTRVISAPPKNLAILQQKLNVVLSLVYRAKWCAFGFVRGRNIVGNAREHSRKRHVLNIDLEDFFPTIHIHRVRGAIRSYGVGDDAALVIAQICTMDNGVLPQGAPTSPIISNIICRSMDNELMQLAKALRCRYTRYADDLTFSTNLPRLPTRLCQAKGQILVGKALKDLIERHDFRINPAKVRHVQPAQRQDVTGLTANEFPNVRRAFVRSMFGALHAWEKHGYEEANRLYHEKYRKHAKGVELRSHLRGKLCFLSMVLGRHSPIYRRATKRFNKLNPTGRLSLPPLTEIAPYPLRGVSPRDPWSLWFARYANSVCLLEIRKPKGDKCHATAFCIGGDELATARHNLNRGEFLIFSGETAAQAEDWYPTGAVDHPDVGLIKLAENSLAESSPFSTQMRLPQIGEEVAAIGYPVLPFRDTTVVLHTGVVEALPVTYGQDLRFVQVSFQSGGGLSGAPLIDKRGFVIGVMAENIFTKTQDDVPTRPYGQAVPIEYLYDLLLHRQKQGPVLDSMATSNSMRREVRHGPNESEKR